MISNVYNDIKPLLFWKFRKWYLWKFDPRYKSFYSKIELHLDNQLLEIQKGLDSYIEKNKKIQEEFNNLPDEYKPFFSKLLSVKIDEEDQFYDTFVESNFFWFFIKPYFVNNKAFTKELSHFEDSVMSYKKTYDIELDNHISGNNVNIELLDQYKNFTIESWTKLLKIIENIVCEIVYDSYSKNVINLVRNHKISSEKLEKIHGNINQLIDLLKSWKNQELYDILFINLASLLDSNIKLLSTPTQTTP